LEQESRPAWHKLHSLAAQETATVTLIVARWLLGERVESQMSGRKLLEVTRNSLEIAKVTLSFTMKVVRTRLLAHYIAATVHQMHCRSFSNALLDRYKLLYIYIIGRGQSQLNLLE
jgi:hypothetical protein